MNRFSSPLVVATTLITTLVIGACSSQLEETTAGIEGTGDKIASSGAVTKLGSIYVNGIHFNTDMAEIYIDGELANDESQLQGMVVDVEGELGDSEVEAYALKVRAKYQVKGPVNSIQVDSDNLLYLTMPGYTVAVPESAVFEGTDYDSLSVGDHVGISGLKVDGEAIYASRISLQDDSSVSSIVGAISDADLTAKQFLINDLVIDYSEALLADIEETLIANGQMVSVSGQLSENESILVASNVSQVQEFTRSDNTYVIDEGFATDYDGTSTFWLNGTEVDASNAFVDGGELTDLTAQARVSVAGTINEDILEAESVRMILPSTIRITGAIQSIDIRSALLRVKDINFTVDPFTYIKDNSGKNPYFDLFDMREGDKVEVYARSTDSGWKTTSLRRTRDDDSKPYSVKARITSVEENGDFYLDNKVFVSIENIPEENLWPYSEGVSVFVVGDVTSEGSIIAEQVFPALSGCTTWEKDFCRPEPDSFDGKLGGRGDDDDGPRPDPEADLSDLFKPSK